MILTAMLKPLEIMLNRYLALDAEQSARLTALHQKVLAIELVPLQFIFYIEIDNNKILLKKSTAEIASAIIRTTPLNGLALLLSKSNTLPENVIITGDLSFIQTLRTILTNIDIDWEEQLSHYVGDTIAHGFGQQCRRLNKYRQSTAQSMQRNISEYLQEEIRLLPPRAECEDFFHDVDVLRDDIERLAAKIQYLQQSHSP